MAKPTLTIKDLAIVQTFLCKALAQPGSRMPAADVFQAVGDSIPSKMDESYFRVSLSEFIRNGTLAGVSIKKGRYGGVSIADLDLAQETAKILMEKGDMSTEDMNVNVEEIKAEKHEVPRGMIRAAAEARAERKANALAIMITKNIRVYPIDRLNWSIQKRTATAEEEDSWSSVYYYGSLDEALNGVARAILDKRLRASGDLVKDLQELRQVVLDAKQDIFNQINIEVKKNIDNA